MGTLVILQSRPASPVGALAESGPPPLLHLLPGDQPLLFMVEDSLLFGMEPEAFAWLQSEKKAQAELVEFMRAPVTAKSAVPLAPPNAISLNIAQSCNLSCSYCYADEGRFGGRASMMSAGIAHTAIDRLFDDACGRRVTVGFIGGEPFLNREVLHSSVEHALLRARETGCRVGFSVTTNGTLLNAGDLDLLRRHAFAVSISLDGSAEVNDRNRLPRNGKSGFDLALHALKPLLREPGEARITARATITRQDLRVLERVEALAEAGFAEVGVSPLRTSPTPDLALAEQDWPSFLQEMVRAAEAEAGRLRDGADLRFSNLAVALKQLHAGYCKPLPCGAAASYVSVSARGEYFTCHRTVDNPRFSLGNTVQGLCEADRETFLRARHVDRQEPCRSCWARYLCGGGCHAEVLSAGRSGCDYIRGWLEYCLRFYDRVLKEHPALFHEGEPAS
jgi:uncharacterized protein